MAKAFVEVWLRGYAKDKLHEISQGASERYHPHITLVRPGKITTSIDDLKKQVVSVCQGLGPLPFVLEGAGVFDEKYHHVPVTQADGLLALSGMLEDKLGKCLDLEAKPEENTNLHASVIPPSPSFTCPRIDQYALRVTVLAKGHIEKGKAEPHSSYVIAFSYDLVTGRVLSRSQSRSNMQWLNTVHEFSSKYGLMPSRNGYVKLSNPFLSRKI